MSAGLHCMHRALAPGLTPRSASVLLIVAMRDDVPKALSTQYAVAQAFVKLRGDGLAYDMSRVEFRFTEVPETISATMYMDGKRLNWCATRSSL